MALLDNLSAKPELLLAAGIGLLAFILMRRTTRHYRQGRTALPPSKTAMRQRSSPALLDAPTDVLRWQVEMHETARDLKAELDSKISGLQALLLLAEQERKQLESLLDRAEQRSRRPLAAAHENSPNPEFVPRSGPILPGSEQQRSEIYMLADQGATPPEISAQLAIPVGEIEFLLGLRSRS